jgi:hypothetical protein
VYIIYIFLLSSLSLSLSLCLSLYILFTPQRILLGHILWYLREKSVLQKVLTIWNDSAHPPEPLIGSPKQKSRYRKVAKAARNWVARRRTSMLGAQKVAPELYRQTMLLQRDEEDNSEEALLSDENTPQEIACSKVIRTLQLWVTVDVLANQDLIQDLTDFKYAEEIVHTALPNTDVVVDLLGTLSNITIAIKSRGNVNSQVGKNSPLSIMLATQLTPVEYVKKIKKWTTASLSADRASVFPIDPPITPAYIPSSSTSSSQLKTHLSSQSRSADLEDSFYREHNSNTIQSSSSSTLCSSLVSHNQLSDTRVSDRPPHEDSPYTQQQQQQQQHQQQHSEGINSEGNSRVVILPTPPSAPPQRSGRGGGRRIIHSSTAPTSHPPSFTPLDVPYMSEKAAGPQIGNGCQVPSDNTSLIDTHFLPPSTQTHGGALTTTTPRKLSTRHQYTKREEGENYIFTDGPNRVTGHPPASASAQRGKISITLPQPYDQSDKSTGRNNHNNGSGGGGSNNAQQELLLQTDFISPVKFQQTHLLPSSPSSPPLPLKPSPPKANLALTSAPDPVTIDMTIGPHNNYISHTHHLDPNSNPFDHLDTDKAAPSPHQKRFQRHSLMRPPAADRTTTTTPPSLALAPGPAYPISVGSNPTQLDILIAAAAGGGGGIKVGGYSNSQQPIPITRPRPPTNRPPSGSGRERHEATSVSIGAANHHRLQTQQQQQAQSSDHSHPIDDEVAQSVARELQELRMNQTSSLDYSPHRKTEVIDEGAEEGEEGEEEEGRNMNNERTKMAHIHMVVNQLIEDESSLLSELSQHDEAMRQRIQEMMTPALAPTLKADPLVPYPHITPTALPAASHHHHPSAALGNHRQSPASFPPPSSRSLPYVFTGGAGGIAPSPIKGRKVAPDGVDSSVPPLPLTTNPATQNGSLVGHHHITSSHLPQTHHSNSNSGSSSSANRVVDYRQAVLMRTEKDILTLQSLAEQEIHSPPSHNDEKCPPFSPVSSNHTSSLLPDIIILPSASIPSSQQHQH